MGMFNGVAITGGAALIGASFFMKGNFPDGAMLGAGAGLVGIGVGLEAVSGGK